MKYAFWVLIQVFVLAVWEAPIWIWAIFLIGDILYGVQWIDGYSERMVRRWKRRAHKAGYRIRLGHDAQGQHNVVITDGNGNYLHGPYSLERAVQWIDSQL